MSRFNLTCPDHPRYGGYYKPNHKGGPCAKCDKLWDICQQAEAEKLFTNGEFGTKATWNDVEGEYSLGPDGLQVKTGIEHGYYDEYYPGEATIPMEVLLDIAKKAQKIQRLHKAGVRAGLLDATRVH